MKYKTLYYDVSAFASRLPDDCLRIIAKYAYDESRYKYLERIPFPCNYYYAFDDEVDVTLNVSNKKYYRLSSYNTLYYVRLFETTNFLNTRVYTDILKQEYQLINNCWKQIR